MVSILDPPLHHKGMASQTTTRHAVWSCIINDQNDTSIVTNQLAALQPPIISVRLPVLVVGMCKMDWESLVSQACTLCMHEEEDSADTTMNDCYSEECTEINALLCE